MSSLEDIHRSIGRLEGKVDLIIQEQDRQNSTDVVTDERLRKTEVKSAVNGFVSGGIVSTSLILIKELFKNVAG